jgi:hypothetical protein
MDLRAEELCRTDRLPAIDYNSGAYWILKCSRCHEKTLAQIGEDTKAVAVTAIDENAYDFKRANSRTNSTSSNSRIR